MNLEDAIVRGVVARLEEKHENRMARLEEKQENRLARLEDRIVGMVAEMKEDTASKFETLAKVSQRTISQGGASSSAANDNPLLHTIGPSVFPKIRVLCDTGAGCMGFCPVDWTRNGVETSSVVFSVTATRILLLEWQPSLKNQDLDIFLRANIVPVEERLALTPSEFEDVMRPTPYRKFIVSGKSMNIKNKSHYVVCSQEFWKSLMAKVEAQFKNDKKHWVTEIPRSVATSKRRYIMMVNDVTEGKRLTAEERKTSPPWQVYWWTDLFERGMASYFGIDTSKPFYHVKSGVVKDPDPKYRVPSFAEFMSDDGEDDDDDEEEVTTSSKKRKKKAKEGGGASGGASGSPRKKMKKKKRKKSSGNSSE